MRFAETINPVQSKLGYAGEIWVVNISKLHCNWVLICQLLTN